MVKLSHNPVFFKLRSPLEVIDGIAILFILDVFRNIFSYKGF